MSRPRAGVTLMEVLIAVTLLSLLSVGMMIAMRVGFTAFSKTNTRLMDNRRVAGAQQILQQELDGLMPVVCACGAAEETPGSRIGFFQGEGATMRLVSTFSLEQAWRGRPQILELFVIPAESGGVRLVVNEIPYQGPESAGQLCIGRTPNPVTGYGVPMFLPAAAGARSFVLADKLAYCRFTYLSQGSTRALPEWNERWLFNGWPAAIRVDMAPLTPEPGRVQPTAVTVFLRVWRSPEIDYAD
jgi:hypothetical protein